MDIELQTLCDQYLDIIVKWQQSHQFSTANAVSLVMTTISFIERSKNDKVIRDHGKRTVALALLRYVIDSCAKDTDEYPLWVQLHETLMPSLIDGIVGAANGELWKNCGITLSSCFNSRCRAPASS